MDSLFFVRKNNKTMKTGKNELKLSIYVNVHVVGMDEENLLSFSF